MFPKINRILFASDISDAAVHAFDYVVSLSNQYEASIIILHVLEDYTPEVAETVSKMIGKSLFEEIKQDSADSARNVLMNKKRQAILSRDAFGLISKNARQRADQSGHSFITEDIVITEGNIVTEIINEAGKSECDVIVMGFKKRSRVAEALIPSIVQGVIRQSKVPVIVVPAPVEESAE